MRAHQRAPFSIGGVEVPPGGRETVELPMGNLITHTELHMPVHVIHGQRDGPRLFVCAAIHGDELNGVEIIRRLLAQPRLERLRGTLIAVPIVNVHGVIQHSRYLPDRRDLNRVFPGSPDGSLAARMANFFLDRIVRHCTHGIDLHTGGQHRSNLPQIRADLDDPETERLARAFGTPVLINAALRDGSLREVAASLGITMLLYEAGEGLRFDELSIRGGVRGILEVMRALDMLPQRKRARPPVEPYIARSSSWTRAPESGIMRTRRTLGARVRKDEALALIADPFGEKEVPVLAHQDGIIIGRTNLPLVNAGDALFHIARFTRPGQVASQVEAFQDVHQAEDPVDNALDPPIV
ncbi:MAG TPA: succinylglutamate desuccinylase/aspartoacylase family protein [Gammaproteobacteria bacterium]